MVSASFCQVSSGTAAWMRVVSVPAFQARASTSMSAHDPMWCTDVTPCSFTYFMAAARCRSVISGVGGGILLSTSAMALSLSRPVRSSEASRINSPPYTAFTSRSRPTALSAAELASAMWPSRRFTHTG